MASIRQSSPPPNSSRLQREARAQGIDPSLFTEQELSYMLRYTPLEEVNMYSLPSMTKPVFVYLVSFPPLSAARLEALKDEPPQVLQTNLGYASVTEGSSAQALYMLWAANVIIDPSLPLVPTDDARFYSTIPGSSQRRSIARNEADSNTLYIRRTSMPAITLYDANDALSRALLEHPPLTLGRWLAVCDPTYQERQAFIQRHVQVAGYDTNNHVSLAAVQVIDKRPQSIGTYRQEYEASYTLQDLRSYTIAEGLEPGDADATRLRQMIRRAQSTNSFYQGVDLQRCEPDATLYGDEYIELPPAEVYSYGSRTDRRGKVPCYHRDELAQQFTVNRQFTDPVTQAPFSQEAVRRLEMLSERDETTEGRLLTRSIITLREEQTDLDRQVKPLVDRLRAATPAQQEVLKEALRDLLEVAMYMRKWSGTPAPYPLKADKTFQKVDPDVVQERVSRAIERLSATLARLPPPLRDTFWQLPLKRFAEGRYYSSIEAANGLTIRQRLDIVVENRGTAACLRLSSNWFLHSALYWSTILFRDDWGIDPAAVDAIG